MKHLLSILILFGLLNLNNFSYAEDKSIEYCADKWYNDHNYDSHKTAKLAIRLHYVLAERYGDWEKVAEYARSSIPKHRKYILEWNNQMLSLLSKSLEEKTKDRRYGWGLEACQEKRDIDELKFEKLWDGPVEIRHLLDDDDKTWFGED